MNASLDHLCLSAAGTRFDGEPADQEWGARHVWLADPDGNRLSLFSTRDEPA
jgi:catechol 2,3-dioxygenase-like lactoylglutathione lyase family enzyme